ncbi:3969_t:CDS:2, partial [Scutellospora calospora]
TNNVDESTDDSLEGEHVIHGSIRKNKELRDSKIDDNEDKDL